MDIKKLNNKGFTSSQINQILKLDGKININKIKVNDSPEFLRELNTLIGSTERPLSINGVIYYGLKKGIKDVSKWYDNGIHNKKQLSIYIDLKDKGYDVEKLFDKKYTLDELSTINKFYAKKIDVSEFVKNYTTDVLELMVKGKEVELDIPMFLQRYKSEQVKRLIFAKELGFDLDEYINEHYSPEHMDYIIYGLKKKLDVAPMLDPSYSLKKVKIIYDGLKKGYDLSDYINDNTDTTKLKAILTVLQAKKDPKPLMYCCNNKIDVVTNAILSDFDTTVLKNSKCTTKRANCIYNLLSNHYDKKYISFANNLEVPDSHIFAMSKLLEQGKSPDILLYKPFNDEQLTLLVDYILKDIDVSHFAKPEYPAYLMKAYAECEQFGLSVTDTKSKTVSR